MITNNYISLEKSSSSRTDALNSIKYTLLFDYQVPYITDKNDPIPEIMKCCNQCCKELFQNDSSSKYHDDKMNFYFFGLPNPSSEKSDNKNMDSNLSFLDEFPPNSDNYAVEKRIGFPTMILDHCVISCYHAILTSLLHETTLTAYEVKNDIGKRGFHDLYKKNLFNFESGNISKKNSASSIPNTQKSSLASDFTKLTTTHLKVLTDMPSLFVEPSKSTNHDMYRYFLQFSGLFYHICQIKAHSWKFHASRITEPNKYNILKSFETLSQSLLPKSENICSSIPEHIFSNFFSDLVDSVYYYYLTERMFNYNLFYSLLHNIQKIETTTNYKLCQKYILDILCCCKKLPNSFSRQYFLQYAFDQLILEPMSYLDYWNSHRFDISNSPLESSFNNGEKDYFQFPRWLKQFSLFCNYMAEFVIPIYGWCFTNMIMDVVEREIPDNSISKENLHTKRLIKAMNLLAGYITKHYHQILQPMTFSHHPDTLDIVTPHKRGTIGLNFSAESLQMLFNVFFSSKENMDLNLSPLRPSFFLAKKGSSMCSNKTNIHNFYLQLLFPN